MALHVEDLEDQTRYTLLLTVPYSGLITFVLEYLKRKSGLMIAFWSFCLIFFGIAFTVRLNIAGYFPLIKIFSHTLLGLLIFPVLCIPVHEFLHVIPYFLAGARKIRVGMDLHQYLFYVTAHRHVASGNQFAFVALVPFISISILLIVLVIVMPGLWKWSLSLFLFVHATMCAGDFALINFLVINKWKKIYTWDDFDKKIAYFYKEI